VIASSDPSIDEAAGGAAQRFDPHDSGALAAAMRGVLGAESACATLITAGRAFAQTRKWQAAGTAYAGAIEDTLATRPRSL